MRLSSLLLAATVATSLTFSVAAQERSYWMANRASNDLMEVTPWGKVLQSIDLGAQVRRCETSPTSGLVWTLMFGSPTFFLASSDGSLIGPLTHPLGSVNSVAFDAQGEAWISGGTGVVHYDVIGNVVQQYPLATPNPRGITIDSLGNKWIAHRELFNAAVSRIDPAGVVTVNPVTGVRPVTPVADFRGPGVPSHIWVACDDNGTLLELDENGVELNNYTIAADISGVVVGLNGDLWVRHSSSASLYQVDSANGAILNTYTVQSPTDPAYTGINAMSVDTLGRILAVQRLNFGPPQPQPAPPCEVQRIDPATGTMEVSTILTVGGVEGVGTIDAPSTPLHYARVVNPNGDADVDGDSNLTEIQNGTSPVDGASNSRFSVDTTGSSELGGTVSINVRQNIGADLWVTAFAAGLLPTPTAAPGFLGSLLIDPATIVSTTAGVGTTSTPLVIPATPSLAGACLFIQGAYLDGALFRLGNLSGIAIW